VDVPARKKKFLRALAIEQTAAFRLWPLAVGKQPGKATSLKLEAARKQPQQPLLVDGCWLNSRGSVNRLIGTA
jgi:hypothetical protein